MAQANLLLGAFNRGLISPLALARVDLTSRLPWSATLQTNWMPRTLGSMMLRPGLQYTGSTNNDEFAKTIPFIFSISDTAELEMTDETMRVWVDDELVERPSVSATVTNGDFVGTLIGWTDADQSGAASTYDNGATWGLSTGNYMMLLGTGFTSAIRYQQVAVGVGQSGIVHALRIVVARGPVLLQVGSGATQDDYVRATTLGTGVHSIAFVPTGDIYITFSSIQTYRTFVQSVEIEAAGVLTVPTPWDTTDLPYLRWDQSADVVFVACKNVQQYRIERRNNNSWSIVLYEPGDGPFRNANTNPGITLTPDALTGNINISSSPTALFNTDMVGALLKITSVGQTINASFNGANQFGNPVRIVGVGAARTFSYSLSGTFSATVSFQRSIGDVGAWVDIATFTGATSNASYYDNLDNQIVYYRWGIKTGNYTSGTAVTNLTYANGGLTGIARITGLNSITSVNAEVLTPFGSTTGSADWAEGAWSDYRGWPGAVALYEGRLWWAGKGFNWGSVSDAFNSFTDTLEGDAGAIARSIGSGPVDTIGWLLPLQRLMIGGEGQEYSARSTSFDEPLTPTNYNVKSSSTQGSANVAALKVDTYGMFVQKSSQRIFALNYNPGADDFTTSDMTQISPQVGDEGFTALAAQRMPDTRLHAVRGDGQVAVLVTDPLENVKAWIMIETDGDVEDAWVLPGVSSPEDRVYYTVKRTVNGQTVRYREKWALEDDCVGGTLNLQADSFLSGTQASSTTITGLDHLEGEEVIVWADGVDFSPGTGDDQVTYTVTSGDITLATAVTNYVVGLPYKAQYRSTKLAYAASFGTALNQMKKVGMVGVIADHMHAKGLQYGSDFDHLDELPTTENEVAVDPDYIWAAYDQIPFTFNGSWDSDSRVCLQATAPRPVTLLSLMVGLETNDRRP